MSSVPVNQQTFPLMDKIINLTLILKDGSSQFIKCPNIGRKPTISISGEMVVATQLNPVEIRVTNLFTGDTPLSAYKYLKVQAGYKGSLQTTIQCEVWRASQETPGPDGITLFECVLGYFTNWTNVTISQTWAAGTSYSSILNYVAGQLGLTLQSNISDGNIAVPVSANGLAKDFLIEFGATRPNKINIYPYGGFLIAVPVGGKTGISHLMNYFIVSPRHEAYGYNIMAPWDPSIKPGDSITLNTKFIRQSYGGTVVSQSGTTFDVQTVKFDFSTTEDTNSMVIQAIEPEASA